MKLGWLKTVSSIFQDVDFYVSFCHSLSVDALDTVSKTCLIIAEHIAIIFATLYVTIATVLPVKTPFI